MKPSKFAVWRVFPYGWWDEPSGAYVIFDRDYRPICRKQTNGAIDQVRPDEFIRFSKQTWLYCAKHPATDAETKRVILGVVERLGLATQISERRRLFGNRQLPRWNCGS